MGRRSLLPCSHSKVSRRKAPEDCLIQPKHDWTRAEVNLIQKELPGKTYAQMAELISKRFGWNCQYYHIRKYCKSHGIKCGFRKGWGKLGEERLVPKGGKNHKPVRMWYVKVGKGVPGADKYGWKLKQHILEERLWGEIPKGYKVVFNDGNPENCVIQILGDHVNGNSEAFLNMFGNVRAARGALTIFNNTADAFNESLEAVGDSAGAADKAFETMADTSEMTQKRMEAAVENLKVSIGEALQPTIDQVKENGISILETANDIIEKNPALVTALGGAAMAVTGVTTAVGVCAGAVTVLRAAFGDLTGAVNVLGTAAAVGAIAGVMATISSTTDTFAASVERTNQAVKDMVTSNQESALSFSETEREMLTTSENAKKYTEEIKELQKETELSTENQNKMKVAVAKLNSVIPELNLAIDEQTGKLDENSVAMLENVEAMLKLQKAEVYRERNKELVEQMVEAEDKLSEATKQRIALETELSEVEQEYARYAAQAREVGDPQYSLDVASRRVEVVNELKTQLESAKEVERIAAEENQNLTDSYNRNTKKIKENTGAARDNAEAQGEVGAAVGLTAEELEEQAKKYEKAKESAMSSLQAQKDKFQELGEVARKGVEDTSFSMDEFAQRIADQKRGIEEYSSNVESALEFMLDNRWSEGLLSSIIEKGPESAADLKLILDTINEGEEGVKKFKDTCKDFDAFTKPAEALSEYQAMIAAGKPITEEAIKKNKEMYDSRGFLIKTYEEGQEAIKTYTDETTAAVTDTPKAAADGMEQNAHLVTEGAEKMVSDMKQTVYIGVGSSGEGGEATVYSGVGESVVSSLAKGLEDKEGKVGTAMTGLCDDVIDSIDLTGIVDKLNEKISKIIRDAKTSTETELVQSTSRYAQM